jgi:hypothetical protein
MAPAATDLWLRVSGIQPALGFEVGLTDPYRLTNAPVSLVRYRGGSIRRLRNYGRAVPPIR